MAERNGKASLISNLVMLGLLVVTGIASLCLWYLGDWEAHRWGLTLTLRILWGSWVVVCLGTILTRVTIFGWSFRQYFRWPEEGRPAWAKFRPTRAPWTKSGATSFSITMTIVLVTAAIAIATVVMWILMDVTGEQVFWLVAKILLAVWWVAMITIVLVRVSLFGWQKHKMAMADRAEPAGTSLSTSETSESNA